MKEKKLWGLFSVILTVILIFTACPGYDFDDLDTVENAEKPRISKQPQGGVYQLGETIAPLTVTVAPLSDKGVLSCQWYSNTAAVNSGGKEISGATDETYTPPKPSKISNENFDTYYYYAVVTNYNKNAKINKSVSTASITASIIIFNPDYAEPPNITGHPRGGDYYVDSEISLSVTASTISEGALSYQWYRNSNNSNTGGILLDGETDASYEFSLSFPGTFYYYVEVTNSVDGKTPSTVTSVTAEVVVDVNPFDTITPNITVTIHNSVNTWPANGGVSTATDRYQYVRGFGGMNTILWSDSNSPDTTNEEIHKLYNPDTGPGLNMMRIFFHHDLDSVLDSIVYNDYFDHIKIVNDYGGYVYAVPWTLPPHLKATVAGGSSGGTILGNSGQWARLDRFPQIAEHFVNYLDKLWKYDAPIFGIALQNEPDGDVGYEGTRWAGTDARNFIRENLGPRIRENRVGVKGVGSQGIKGYGGGREWEKIWMAPGEAMGGAQGSNGAQPTVNDSVVREKEYIQFAAHHMYQDSSMNRYSTAFGYGIETWATEWTDGGNDLSPYYDVVSQWRFAWEHANMIYASIVLNENSVYFPWYLKRFYLSMGDGERGTTNGEVLNRGWMLGHFSKYAADTRRIRVSATGEFLSNQGGTTANTANTQLTLSSSGTTNNFNPASFVRGAALSAGHYEPSTKIMAFQSPADAAAPEDVESIVVIAFTPIRHDGSRGQNAGNILINLPAGFSASHAECMRSFEGSVHKMERVIMKEDGTAAIVNLPRSNIVSIKFTR